MRRGSAPVCLNYAVNVRGRLGFLGFARNDSKAIGGTEGLIGVHEGLKAGPHTV